MKIGEIIGTMLETSPDPVTAIHQWVNLLYDRDRNESPQNWYDIPTIKDLEEVRGHLLSLPEQCRKRITVRIISLLTWDNGPFYSIYWHSKYYDDLHAFFIGGVGALKITEFLRCPQCNHISTDEREMAGHMKRSHMITATGTYAIAVTEQILEIILPQLIPGQLQCRVFSDKCFTDWSAPDYMEIPAQLANKLSTNLLYKINCATTLVFGGQSTLRLFIKKTPAVEHAIAVLFNAKSRKEIINAINKAAITDKETFVKTLMFIIQAHKC